MSGLGFTAKLLFNQGHETLQSSHVVGRDVCIVHFDLETLLNKRNEFDYPLRIDHISEQRSVVIEGFTTAKKKLLSKIVANFLFDFCHLQVHIPLITVKKSSTRQSIFANLIPLALYAKLQALHKVFVLSVGR